jgi:antitoxin (DNA-binding transcriptional repressor) of toxin-antitoxin stability system
VNRIYWQGGSYNELAIGDVCLELGLSPEERETGGNIMAIVTIQEAQAGLLDLIHKLLPGDEVVITEDNQPVAKLVASPADKPRPIPGRCKGMLTILAEDNEHLEGFKEYMP